MAKDEAYRQAEETIAEAKKKDAAVLDLCGMDLTAIPTTIANLTQLQKLNLYHNQLKEVPIGITNLTQLRCLGLGNNKITA